MPVPITYADDAASTAVGTRLVGGASLTLLNASKFGSPSPDRPARIVVRRAGVIRTILKATGRGGNTLTISGTFDGYADAQVDAGDDCRIAWTKGDAEAPYLYIDAALEDLITVDDLASALSAYATSEALAAGLAGKQGALSLTTIGTSGPATLIANTLNIPQYPGGGGGVELPSYAGNNGKALTLVTGALAWGDFATTTALASLASTVGTKADASAVATALGLKADASALSAYALTSALTSGLAGKQNTLPVGTTAQYFRGDQSLATFSVAGCFSFPSDGSIAIASGSGTAADPYVLRAKRRKTIAWIVADVAAGATGDAATAVPAPFACKLVAARMYCRTNPTGTILGQVKAGGSNQLGSSLSLAAGVAGPVSATIGSPPSIALNALIVATWSALPSDARGVVVEIEILED